MKDQSIVELRWLSIACFEFHLGDSTIISDPCVTNSPGTPLDVSVFNAADLVFLTHTHWDHVTDLPALEKQFQPKILVGALSALSLTRWLNCNSSRIYPMTSHLELDFGTYKIQALFGRHTDVGQSFLDVTKRINQNPLVGQNRDLQDMQAWGSLEYCNYLITTKSGIKILLWGNNASIEQVNMIRGFQPDIAILQFSRQSPEEIAQFAQAIGTHLIIPHHMDLYQTEDVYRPRIAQLQRIFEDLDPNGVVLSPVHGQWYRYDCERKQLLAQENQLDPT